MTLDEYIDKLSDVQFMIYDASCPSDLLKCESILINILLEAEADDDLTEDNLDEIWERREHLLIEIYEKYPTLRESMVAFLPNLRY